MSTPAAVPSFSRVLITGSAGFLGQSLVTEAARAGFPVRAMDVVPTSVASSGDIDVATGDVARVADVAAACTGCDAMVIAHMAPNRPEVYASADAPFDINVKGTALLLEAAVRHRMKRVVLISSIAVVDGHRPAGKKLVLDLPPKPTSLYGLTKTLQEEMALYYHRAGGIPVAVLRPAYITDADNLTDKYDRRRESVNWQFIDRRDVAGATVAALRLPTLTFARYFLPGHPEAAAHMEVASAITDLNWFPRYDFSAWPPDAPT